ncbi:BrxA family protein [Mariniflexile ostreae]|uniref:BrxA family protein n=1 Tax=Mariniflexile ostreae TaxID=1520892 RepID=A0ABV5FAS7_9FLAO
MPKKTKYDANFTAGGLLFTEFKALETILLSSNFKELIKKEEEQNKVIGIATNSSRKRIISEIKRRYDQVNADFWNHFFQWSDYEQKLGLFYLCLKTYPLVLDIHIEVALKKFKMGSSMDAYDIQMRMEEIMSYDDEVANWSEKTFYKMNTQYRKVLKDVGMYNGKKLNRPEKASLMLWSYFKQINGQWFLKACFIENI